MAVAPRHGEITRDQVQKWVSAYKKLSNPTMTLEDFVRDKIDKANLKDRKINTSGHDDLDEETDIADLIISDLASYGS